MKNALYLKFLLIKMSFYMEFAHKHFHQSLLNITGQDLSMKKVKLRWRGKEIEGLLIAKKGEYLEIKLKSGYNIMLNENEVEILKEEEFKRSYTRGEEGKGEVRIIGCGGTIGSKVDYETGGVSPQISASELVAQYPEIKDIAGVETRMLFSILSENMKQEHWEKIVDEVAKAFEEEKRVVLLHGTDTMHYTASSLAFAFRGMPFPVVLTGSQRSSDRPSSDARLNLLNAIYTSKQEFGEVAIVMHSSINDNEGVVLRGVRARKMHSTRRDAFKPINEGPLAFVDFKKGIEWLSKPSKPVSDWKVENGFSRKVAMVYIYPGIEEGVFDYYKSYDGIVLLGTGMGHTPTDIIEKIKEMKGIVVMSTQTIYGRINLNVYSTGRLLKKAGVIGHELDITPEAAFVKLSWILYRTKERQEVERLFYTNMANEFSMRSVI